MSGDSGGSTVLGFIIGFLAVIALSLGADFAERGGTFGPTGRHVSPFTAVRGDTQRLEVRIDGEFHELSAINGVTTTELIATSLHEFDERWIHRLGEDLDAVFLARGTPLACPATVHIIDHGTLKELTVPCTEHNRQEALRYNRQHPSVGHRP